MVKCNKNYRHFGKNRQGIFLFQFSTHHVPQYLVYNPFDICQNKVNGQ